CARDSDYRNADAGAACGMAQLNSANTLMTRRRFGVTAAYALGTIAFGDACLVTTGTGAADRTQLTARPRPGAAASLQSGRLGLSRSDRDGLVQIPSTIAPGPMPLLVFLHGATQSGAGMLRRIGAAAEQAGVAVVAPDSRDTT